MKGLYLIYAILPVLVLNAWQQVRAASVRDQLVQVRTELATKRQRLMQTRKQEKATVQKMQASKEGMLQQKQRVQGADKRIQSLRTVIAQRQKLMDGVRHTKAQLENLKADRAVEMFKQAAVKDELDDFAALSIGPHIASVYAASSLNYDRKVITDHGTRITSLEQQKAGLQADKKQQETVRSEGQREYARLETDTRKHKVALTVIQNDQKRIAAEIREYEAKQQRLKTLLAQLNKSQNKKVRRPATSGKDSMARQPDRPAPPLPADFEKFNLPLRRGKVVRGYGVYRNPDWGTSTFSNGLSIMSEAGSAVRSIAGGTVAYAGELKGYGNIIIIDHGQQVFSVYSQCGNILKSVGAQIIKGEDIATAGQAEGEKPSLYFELRSRGRAVNPAKWIVG